MSLLDQIASGGTPPVNPLDTLGKLQSLRTGQMQQQGLALENQTRGLQVQQQQQAMKDQQAVTSAYQQWKPEDGYDALAHLTVQNGGSGNAAMAIQKHALDYAKGISEKAKMDAETGSKNIESMIAQHNIVAGKIANLQNVPDDQLGQAINVTAQELSSTKGYDGKPLIDPQHTQTAAQIAQMPPQQARAALAILQKDYMGQTQQMKAAMDQSDLNAKAAQLPGQQAESDQKVRANFATQLAGAGSQDAYDAMIAKMPFAIAKQFPAKYDHDAVLAVGMTPHEQASVPVEMQAAKAWLAKNPGKTMADFNEYNKKLVPAYNFNLQNPLNGAGTSGKTGQDLLSSLDPKQQAFMKGLLNYTLDPKDIPGRGPQRMQAMGLAKQIDPNFDEQQYELRYNTQKYYSPAGEGGKIVKSFDTAMRHAELLKDAIGNLGNTNSQTWNAIKNKISTEFGGTPVTDFNSIANLYNGELTKMVAGGHITDSELGQNHATIQPNMGPQQLLNALDNYKKLAASKKDVEYENYQKAMSQKSVFDAAPGQSNGAPTAQKGAFDWNAHPVVKK